MLCAKFGWNWPSNFVFFVLSMYFRYFVNIYPWERAWPFICINLNPFHQNMCCAKFCWNWPSCSGESDFINVFSLFRNYPLWKGRGPSLVQPWVSFTQGCFVPSLVEFGPVVLEKKMKSLQTDRWTDGQMDERSENLIWAFSSGKLKHILKKGTVGVEKFELEPRFCL